MPNINLDGLLPGQRKCLRLVMSQDWKRVIWFGSIRSGKGVGVANALMHLALRRWADGTGVNQYAVAGATAGSFMRNNENYLMQAAEHIGSKLTPVGGPKPGYILEPGIARFYLFGGGNTRSFHPVRGLDLDGAWIDEATLCDKQFVQTCEERLSYPQSQIILSTNTDAPSHFIKTEWIDEPAERGDLRYPAWEKTRIIATDFHENTYYPEEQRQHFLAQNPASTNYQRAIMNIWAGAEGLVYPIPTESVVDVDTPLIGDVFIDPATAGRTAALLFVKRPQGGYIVADEYYHDGDKQGRLTDAEHWSRIKGKWDIGNVWVDPAAANFRAVISRDDKTPRLANNAWLAGVQITNNALFGGDLTIHRRCANLISCCAGLQYNARGTNSLPGTPDDLPDCLRYGATNKFPRSTAILLR